MNYSLGVAAGKVVIDASEATSALEGVKAAAASVGDQVAGKVADVEQFGKSMQVAGAAGVGAFGIAVKAAANFEQGLSAIRAVSGATTAEMELISAAALRIGADTSFSATEAASAMEELVKAGLSVEDTLNGAADATVALAAAGGVSLPEAASIASAAMNQFGLAAGDLPKVADNIAGAANASAIDVSEFGQSLNQVGGVAKLVGLSFEETAVAIAEMGNQGYKGSDAGTSLKTMFLNLQPTTDKQIDKFRELGLSTFDTADALAYLSKQGIEPMTNDAAGAEQALRNFAGELSGTKVGTAKANKEYEKLLMTNGLMQNSFFTQEGTLKSLSEVQQVLADATSDMTDEQKTAALEILFGTDAIRAASVMAGEGAAGYDKLAAGMSKVTAADVAKARLDNLGGSIEALKGSFETALITVGNVLLPIAKAVTDFVTTIINAFNNLGPGVQKGIAVALAAITALLVVGGTLLTLIVPVTLMLLKFLAFRQLKGIAAIFIRFGTVLRTTRSLTQASAAANVLLSTTMTSMGRTAKVAAVGVKILAASLKFLRAAFLPLLIITAIVAAVVYAYKNFESFRNVVDSVGNAIKSTVMPVLQRLGGYFQSLGAIIAASVGPAIAKVTAVLPGLVAHVVRVGQALAADLVPRFQSLVAMVAPTVGAILRFAQGLTSADGPITALGGFITGTLVPALASIGRFIAANVLPVLASLAAFFLGTILPVLVTVAGFLVGVFVKSIIDGFKGIVQAVGGLYNVFAGIVNFFKALFTGDFAGMWEAVKQIFTGAFNTIAGLLKAWLNFSVLKVFAVGFALVRGIIAAGWGFIRAIFTGAIGALRGVVSGGLGFIRTVFVTIFNAVRAVVMAGWNFIRGLFTSGSNGARNVVTSVFGGIRSLFMMYFNAYRAIVTGAFNAIRAVISAVLNTIRAIVSAVWNGIRSTISSVVSGIRSTVSSGFNAARSAAVTAFNALRSGVTSALNGLMSFVRGIPGKIRAVFSGAKNLLLNAGRQIIDGLISGIRRGIDKVKEVLQGVTGLIPDWKGPANTDKKLLIKNGQYVMGGFIRGLESQIRPMEKSLKAVTTSIPVTVKSGMPVGLAPVRQRLAAAEQNNSRNITVNAPVTVQERPDANLFGSTVAFRVRSSV